MAVCTILESKVNFWQAKNVNLCTISQLMLVFNQMKRVSILRRINVWNFKFGFSLVKYSKSKAWNHDVNEIITAEVWSASVEAVDTLIVNTAIKMVGNSVTIIIYWSY